MCEKKTNKTSSKFLIQFSILTLLAYQFYSGHFLNQFLIKLSCNILIVFLSLYTYKYWIRSQKDIPFHKETRAFFFVILCSILMTYIFKDQSFFLTFNLFTRGALQILFFFLLWKLKPEKIYLKSIFYYLASFI